MWGGFIQFKDNVAEKHDSQWCRANASKIFAQIEAISKMLELPNSKGKDVPIAGSKKHFSCYCEGCLIQVTIVSNTIIFKILLFYSKWNIIYGLIVKK